MVRLFLTADANINLSKLAKQMEVMGLQPDVLWHEHKVLCDIPFPLIRQKVQCLNLVERVFFCLHCEGLHNDHLLFASQGGGEGVEDVARPNYGVLQDWILGADWATCLQNLNALHGISEENSTFGSDGEMAGKMQKRWRWHVDCRRRSKASSKVGVVDNLVAKQKIREALHEVLGPLGCQHDRFTPTMTVFVCLSQHYAFLGVPIFERCVKKGRFPHKGLHHTTAWGLALTAKLRQGDVVADPMAGKGIVLLEAAAFWPECTFVGVEIDREQLAKASENAAAHPDVRCELMRGDARCLPLAAESVDVVLCDLPFGRQYGDAPTMPALYRSVLAQVHRVLRSTGRAVFLTSEDHVSSLLSAASGLLLPIPPSPLPFKFGGNRDRHSCALCCFVNAKQGKQGGVSEEVVAAQAAEAAETFDWTLQLALEADPEFTWKDIKPSLTLYRPSRSKLGSAKLPEE